MPALSQTGVKVLIDHMGCPFEEQWMVFEDVILKAGHESKNIYVMLSGGYRFSEDPEYVTKCAQSLLKAYGPDRLIWASDYPFTRYEDIGLSVEGQIEKLKTWVPDEKQRQKVMYDTAFKLFRF